MEFNYTRFLTENKLTTGSKLKSLVESMSEEESYSENFNGYISSTDGQTFTLYDNNKDKIKDVSFEELKSNYMSNYPQAHLEDFRQYFDRKTNKGKYKKYWKGTLVNVKLSNINESIDTDDMEDAVSNDDAYEKAFDYMDTEEVVEVEDMEDDMSDSEPTAKDVKSNKSTGDLAKKQYQLASLIKHKDDLVMKFKSGQLTIDQYKEKIGNIPQHIKKLSLDIENLESQDTF